MGADAAVALDGRSLTFEGVVALARRCARPVLDPAALERVVRGRRTVTRGIAENRAMYGITRGTGQLWSRPVEAEQARRSTHAAVRDRLRFGEDFPATVGRAVLAAMANALLSGRSGARPQLVEHMTAMLEHGIAPILPRDVGLLGIGDLGAMEQLAATIAGEGIAEYAGARMPSAMAHERAGIEPLPLEPPESTVLAGSNGISLGLGSLVLAEVTEVALLADVSAALALSGYAANLSVVRAEVSAACPLPGHVLVAGRIRRLLDVDGPPEATRTLQDPLSFRCAPQVHGALADAIEFASTGYRVLLNAGLVNPLVVSESDEVFSHGNFDLTRVSLAFDVIRIALAEVAHMAVERIQKQMWPSFGGLPTGLDPSQGTGRGMNELGRFAAQLAAEVRRRAQPTTGTMTVALADGINDHMTGTPLGIMATREACDALTRLLALELVVGAQAVELRGLDGLGAGMRTTHEFVRETIPFLTSRTGWAPDLDGFAARVTGDLLPRLAGIVAG
jgi:histidine ammonia-lyase